MDNGWHKLSENIWFVWSKRSYSGDKKGCHARGRTDEPRNVKIELEFWKQNSQKKETISSAFVTLWDVLRSLTHGASLPLKFNRNTGQRESQLEKSHKNFHFSVKVKKKEVRENVLEHKKVKKCRNYFSMHLL